MSDTGWTLASLKEYVDQQLKAQVKAVDVAMASADKALEKAESSNERWRQSANEWRAAMTDREAKFITRAEMDARFEAVKAAQHQGTGDHRANLLMVVSLIGLLVVLWKLSQGH